jgi:hypothetical protein
LRGGAAPIDVARRLRKGDRLFGRAAVLPAVIGQALTRRLLLDAAGVRCTPGSLAAAVTLKRPDPYALPGHGAGVALLERAGTVEGGGGDMLLVLGKGLTGRNNT